MTTEKMSHKEYVGINRLKLQEIIKNILDEKIDLLEACAEIMQLSSEVGFIGDESEFNIFIGVLDELDDIAQLDKPALYHQSFLDKSLKKKNDVLSFHKPAILKAADRLNTWLSSVS